MADYLKNFSLEGKIALITGGFLRHRLCHRKGYGRRGRNHCI